MSLSEMLVGATIRFSKGGWLLMSKGRKTLFFYNPFTKAAIQLPDLPEIYSFTGIAFSSLPTSSDCVVFGIAQDDWFEISIFVCNIHLRHCTGKRFLEDGFIWKVLAKPRKHFNVVYPSFLVECDRKLLLVDLGPLGKSVEIFSLDFSKMVWVKVESLGKHMLFISNTSCLSAIAPNSCMENKIYLARLHGEEILFYSLGTGRVTAALLCYCMGPFARTQ
ncbi:Protein of unknown function DUF295 [Macleaya cordata]|uniref:KIB1-4 beta-propeller domain-containing protein n=1 Tax=Macleaya cordata TaxID=56857 RepID=A0A200Q1Y6_MACCD|nr:Protein of unknown function DUF295 [Macleaya cordata]